MNKQEVQTGLDWIRKLEDRALDVAHLAYPDFVADFVHISFDPNVDYVHADVTLRCQSESYQYFPMRYLWMDDAAILEEIAERKRKELEAQRLRDIEQAERKIKQLRAAASDLAKEEARLAKLKGGA